MASSETITKIVSLLEISYNKEPSDDRFRIYLELLSDVPDKFLLLGVKRHIEVSKWYPTIAELRERAWELCPGGEKGQYMWTVENFGEDSADRQYLETIQSKLEDVFGEGRAKQLIGIQVEEGQLIAAGGNENE